MKIMPAGFQNGSAISAKIQNSNVIIDNKKESECMNKHVFLKGWKLDFERRTPYVVQKQGTRGLLVERCLHAETTKNQWQTHPKTDEKPMEKQCKIHIRKSDATNLKKHWKLIPKRNHNPWKGEEKRGRQIYAKLKVWTGQAPAGLE